MTELNTYELNTYWNLDEKERLGEKYGVPT